MRDAETVLYWDASAVLSLLFHDSHSESAAAKLQTDSAHLMSSLAWVETYAVIERVRRTGAAAEEQITDACEKLDRVPWHRIATLPDWSLPRALARRWRLRGADLWHLSLAKTLQRDLPELEMLTYDTALREAAAGEGLVRD